MGIFAIIGVIIQVIQLILKLKDLSEREAAFVEMGQAVAAHVEGKDKKVLGRLRDRLKVRCNEQDCRK